MKSRDIIGIDSELADKLRQFAFKKYGTTYGVIKSTAEEAIKSYIKE